MSLPDDPTAESRALTNYSVAHANAYFREMLMSKKQTTDEVSSAAARMLRRGRPDWMPRSYWADLRKVLGSALSQDEVRGPRTKAGKRGR